MMSGRPGNSRAQWSMELENETPQVCRGGGGYGSVSAIAERGVVGDVPVRFGDAGKTSGRKRFWWLSWT